MKHASRVGQRAIVVLALSLGLVACGTQAPQGGGGGAPAPTASAAPIVFEPVAPAVVVTAPPVAVATAAPTVAPTTAVVPTAAPTEEPTPTPTATPEPEPTGLPTPRPTPKPEPTPDLLDNEDEPNDTVDQAQRVDWTHTIEGELDADAADLFAIDVRDRIGQRLDVIVTWDEDEGPIGGDLVVYNASGLEVFRDNVPVGASGDPILVVENIAFDSPTYYVGFDFIRDPDEMSATEYAIQFTLIDD